MLTSERKKPKRSKIRYAEYYDLQKTLDSLYADSSKGKVFTHLMELISSKENIRMAYRTIKGNTGSGTAGVDERTIQDLAKLSEERYVALIQRQFKSYHPRPVRRVEIPKPNGKTRPLGIPTIVDRIVQQCVLQVLEPICEAKFYDHSYGFRPNRSTEHAIARCNQLIQLSNLHYVVDIDIKGFFDKVLVQPESQAGDLLCHHALYRLFPAQLSPRRNEAMNRKKKENAAQSTRQLMGIDGIKDYCIATRMGDLVFFIIKPTNISVLSDSSISARIYALLNVVKGQAEIEMLALNSKESFERNKNFYQERMGNEELPAIRRLLEQDSKHLDRIQVLMASSREFYIIIRLRSEKETDVFPYLSRIEQSINDNGFTTRRATDQDLKRMLGVYFEQNVTTEKFEDYDGDRWVIVGE